MVEDNDIKKMDILYSKNAEVIKMLSEAQQTAITRHFTAIIATVAMAGWFYERCELRQWIFVPFIFAFFVSFMTYIITKLNSKNIHKCYHVGMTIEERISSDIGLFKAIDDTRDERNFYHKILHGTCLISASIFFILIFLAFYHFSLSEDVCQKKGSGGEARNALNMGEPPKQNLSSAFPDLHPPHQRQR